VTLVWHNEEAFHEHRADFLSILCYRNDERARTIFCGIDEIDVPDDMWRVLSAPRFTILPDTSHLPEQNVSQHWRLDDHVFAHIRRMHENPAPVPALSGVRAKPWMRVDEAFMAALPGDDEARLALRWLIDACYAHQSSVVMQPGDMVWIDNKRAVHGRTVYQPNYGPRQRWLRRVNVHGHPAQQQNAARELELAVAMRERTQRTRQLLRGKRAIVRERCILDAVVMRDELPRDIGQCREFLVA
jgi:hypothetical protein